MCPCDRETCSPPAPEPGQPLWNAARQHLLNRRMGAPCAPAQDLEREQPGSEEESEAGVSDRTVL